MTQPVSYTHLDVYKRQIEQGKILIDGYDLTKVSMNSLRRQMGVMTQDTFIFHGTVKDNILYGKLDAKMCIRDRE